MRQYFANHPVIEYRGLNLRNLMLSAGIVKGVLNKMSVAYPYTLNEGDTPNMVAYDYYGSVEYVWLVFLANHIVDPYTQWYKSQSDFESYVTKKYGSIESAMITTHHFSNQTDLSAPEVSVTTYQHATPEEQGVLTPVSNYDFEVSQNEIKRSIMLVDKSQAARISLELERLLK